MAFKTIKLTLTAEQLTAIRGEIDPTVSFALLAQPWIRGKRSGELTVHICTAEQYALLDSAVKAARDLQAYAAPTP